MCRRLLVAVPLVLGVVVLAALLAPPFQHVGVAWGLTTPERFPKLVRRILVVGLVALVLAAFRPWREGGLGSYGLVGPRARLVTPAFAWSATVIVMLGILTVHLATGWLVVDDPVDTHEVVKRLWRWFLLGWTIALAEEWFFRGWMDRRFQRFLTPRRSALLVAGVFAFLHVFEGEIDPTGIEPTVLGAFESMARWFGRFLEFQTLVPSLVGLFLFSLVLTAVWRRTGTLWADVGIHAGAVFVLKCYGAATTRDPEWTWAGSKHLFDGPPGWIVMGLALVGTRFVRPRR